MHLSSQQIAISGILFSLQMALSHTIRQDKISLFIILPMETITKAANLKKRIFIVRASDKTFAFPAIFQTKRRDALASSSIYKALRARLWFSEEKFRPQINCYRRFGSKTLPCGNKKQKAVWLSASYAN